MATNDNILDLFIENWELYSLIILAVIEYFLRKIPTLSNLSLVYTFNRLLDIFVKNNAIDDNSVDTKKHVVKDTIKTK